MHISVYAGLRKRINQKGGIFTDKKELFQIGEVANLFNISVSTLRHYEKIGLLPPEYVDKATGYRYYSTSQFECLNTIRYLRVLGTPLGRISEFLKNRNLDNIKNLLTQQKSEIKNRLNELKIIEKKIDNRLYLLDDAIHSELNTIKLRTIPSKRIAWIKHNFAVETYLDLEIPIRRLESHQREALVFLGKVGVGISEQNMKKGCFSKYDRVFLILDDVDNYEGETSLLPDTEAVTVRFCGSHREAEKYYRLLMEFVKNNDMQIAGFSSEITMIDYGYTDETNKFVTEIQIPVKRNKTP